MKQADVKIGSKYVAKVSGVLTVVRVIDEYEGYHKMRYVCINTQTGRTCHMTAAKLRREVL